MTVASTTAISAGDTAWMLVATALVLLMTPALGLFYAGLVRAKNTLNTFMMCVAALAIATVTWATIGYSLAFSHGTGFIGGSTTAPETSAVVTMQKVVWKAKNSSCGMWVPGRGAKPTPLSSAWPKPPMKPLPCEKANE